MSAMKNEVIRKLRPGSERDEGVARGSVDPPHNNRETALTL
jgi:hypothetical protein